MVRKMNTISPMCDKDYQAECDARDLARAEEIKKDPRRMRAAAAKAKKMADEKIKEAAAMKKIAGRSRKK